MYRHTNRYSQTTANSTLSASTGGFTGHTLDMLQNTIILFVLPPIRHVKRKNKNKKQTHSDVVPKKLT